MPGKTRILRKSLLKLDKTPEGVYVEYSALVTSESKPGVRYHTTVGLLFKQGGRVEIKMWSCNCDASTYKLICKHVRAVANSALKELRSTVKSMLAGGRESEQKASVSA